jgi:thiol:disulfide interchange protein DsbC
MNMFGFKTGRTLAKWVAATALGFAVSGVGLAQSVGPEETVVKNALESKFPKAKIGNIRKAVVPGMFEATIDNDVIYIDAKGTYMFAGGMYDLATMTNQAEARGNELFGFKWDELPFDKAIKMVRGKGTRRVAVFTDADCPFCKRVEQTFQTIDDITVYNFLMPIDSLHPDAGRKSKIIWCSKDRTKAWLDFMLNGKLVEGKGDCPNPVEELKALGASKRVNGTPALVFPDNRTIPGAIPKQQIEDAMNRAEAQVKQKASLKQ